MQKLLVFISIISLFALSSCFGNKENNQEKKNPIKVEDTKTIVKEENINTDITKNPIKIEEIKEKTNSGKTEIKNEKLEDIKTEEKNSSTEIKKETESLENEIIGELENLIKDLNGEIKK